MTKVMADELDELHLVQFSGGQSKYFARVEYGGKRWLYKSYKQEFIPSPERAKELESLVSWATMENPEICSYGAFPHHVVYDNHGQCQGILMHYAPSRFFTPTNDEQPVSMEALAAESYERNEYWESSTTAILGHLLNLVLDLHAGGWVLGDLMYTDVLVSTRDMQAPVFLVDCDSFFREHDPRVNNDLMSPPDDEALSARTDLYKWSLLVERFLGPYSTLPPDRLPLLDDVRSIFGATHLQLLDSWKEGTIPADPQTELRQARALAHAMTECATHRGRSVLRGSARIAIRSAANLVLLVTLVAAPAALASYLWIHRELWQAWWVSGIGPCHDYLPSLLLGGATVLLLIGLAVGSAGRIYGPSGWKTGSMLASCAILICALGVLLGNPWHAALEFPPGTRCMAPPSLTGPL